MTKISETIVFFGTEDFSLATLQQLIEAGYFIAAVITKPDAPRGRGHRLAPPRVKVLAQQHNIPVLQPQKLKDITENLRSLGPATGVLVSYGKIIPQSIIDLFVPGIINVHPSLLPKYRGPSPIESAIEHGDQETGVSIMQLSAAMDAGPVYTQIHHPLTGAETQPELYATLAQKGAKTLLEVLPAIMSGELQPIPQNDADATYCQLLGKEDAWLNPTNLTASQAERKVRAHLSWPKSKLRFGDHTIVVTKAHAASTQKTPLDFACRDGGFLCIDELIAPSGRHMNADAFLRGYAAA
jgi:methionyl-tRNA formyltransferase